MDSGASGHYFDDPIVPSLKHRLLNYVLLTTTRNIINAGGALLGGMAEGILQGLVTDNHGEYSSLRGLLSSLCNLFSGKSTTKKGVVSIFDFDKPRLELSDITALLRAEDDQLYS